MSEYVKLAVEMYLIHPIDIVEKLLDNWLSDDWGKSPYRDILVPYLIKRKLELNEIEEYVENGGANTAQI